MFKKKKRKRHKITSVITARVLNRRWTVSRQKCHCLSATRRRRASCALVTLIHKLPLSEDLFLLVMMISFCLFIILLQQLLQLFARQMNHLKQQNLFNNGGYVNTNVCGIKLMSCRACRRQRWWRRWRWRSNFHHEHGKQQQPVHKLRHNRDTEIQILRPNNNEQGISQEVDENLHHQLRIVAQYGDCSVKGK